MLKKTLLAYGDPDGKSFARFISDLWQRILKTVKRDRVKKHTGRAAI
jgi:hypothetical protein